MNNPVEVELKEKNKSLHFLNRLACELAEQVTSEYLAVFLARKLKEFTEAVFVTYSVYDREKKVLVIQHIETGQSVLNNVTKVAGQKILQTNSPVSDEIYREMVHEIIGIRHSLTEATFGAISPNIDKALKKVTGITHFYGISYVIAGELYGTSLLGFKAEQAVPSNELLESFAHMAAISLRRKKAEDLSREREEKYRLLIENQGEGIGIVDPEENFLFANPAAEQIFGVSPGQLVKRNLKEFIVPEHLSMIMIESKNRIKTGKSSYEIDIVTPAGQRRNVLVTATPQVNEKQEHIGSFGIFRDITDRKQTEFALLKSEELYRNLVERMPDGVYKSTHNGRFVEVNKAMVRMLGYESKEELLSIDIKTQLYFQPSDRESLVLQEKLEELGIYPLKKKDGSAIWVEDHGWYIQDENENIIFHEGILRDVSERKKAEDALHESDERYRVFINATKDMAFMKDESFKYQLVNHALTEFFGKEEALILGTTDYSLMSYEAADRCHITDLGALECDTVVVSEEVIEGHIYETHKFKIPLSNGRSGIGGYIRDITERREAEIKLIKQAEELKALNSTREKFFSIIAHDLKSPFNAISGFSELLLENYHELDGDAVKRSLQAISGASKQAFSLLENLLIWSRSQTGQITYNPEEIDLHEKVSGILNLLEMQTDKKQIYIESDISSPFTMTADKNMIGTILRNLLTNAVKFTPRGGKIKISAEKQAGLIIITVSDTGIGISPENLDNIFRIDSKTSTPGTEKEKGSGLGLIICRDFIEKHGGKIWGDSEVGQGSTFRFSIPNIN